MARPGDIAKRIARKRGSPTDKVVTNPKLRLTDLLTAMDIEHGERVKLEKEVKSLRRKLDLVMRQLLQN